MTKPTAFAAALLAAALLVCGCSQPEPVPEREVIEPPVNPEAMFERAFHSLVLGETGAAADGFASILALPDAGGRRAPDAMFWRAYCAEIEGDVQGAADHYSALLDKHPASPYAPLAQKRLAVLQPENDNAAKEE